MSDLALSCCWDAPGSCWAIDNYLVAQAQPNPPLHPTAASSCDQEAVWGCGTPLQDRLARLATAPLHGYGPVAAAAPAVAPSETGAIAVAAATVCSHVSHPGRPTARHVGPSRLGLPTLATHHLQRSWGIQGTQRKPSCAPARCCRCCCQPPAARSCHRQQRVLCLLLPPEQGQASEYQRFCCYASMDCGNNSVDAATWQAAVDAVYMCGPGPVSTAATSLWLLRTLGDGGCFGINSEDERL